MRRIFSQQQQQQQRQPHGTNYQPFYSGSRTLKLFSVTNKTSFILTSFYITCFMFYTFSYSFGF